MFSFSSSSFFLERGRFWAFIFFFLLSSSFSKKPVVSASYKRRYTSDSHANAGTGLKEDAEEKRGKVLLMEKWGEEGGSCKEQERAEKWEEECEFAAVETERYLCVCVCTFDAGLYVSALQNNTIKRSLTSSAWYSQDINKEREQYCQFWPAPQLCHCTNTAKRLILCLTSYREKRGRDRKKLCNVAVCSVLVLV